MNAARWLGDEAHNEETESLLTRHESGDPTENRVSQVKQTTYGAVSGGLVNKDDGAKNDDGGDDDSGDGDDDEREIAELQKKRLQEQGGWLGYLKGFLVFLPCILPYKDRYTQFWLLVLVICVTIQRFLTLMIPRQLGAVTDALTDQVGGGAADKPLSSLASSESPRLWKEILIWGLLQFPTSSLTSMFKEMASARVS